MMLSGGVPLLFAIIILAINHAGFSGAATSQQLSFSLPVLLATPLPEALQGWVFLLLLLGFAVKAPLVPFHTWLPTAAMEGPTQLTALLTGLKLGAFGILRFALPLAPSAAVQHSWILGILGAITLIYGALIALQQSNLRRLLAYASISHVGLVIIGIASLNMQGLQGAIFQLLNFTLIASSLMLIAGFFTASLWQHGTCAFGRIGQSHAETGQLIFSFYACQHRRAGHQRFCSGIVIVDRRIHGPCRYRSSGAGRCWDWRGVYAVVYAQGFFWPAQNQSTAKSRLTAA